MSTGEAQARDVDGAGAPASGPEARRRIESGAFPRRTPAEVRPGPASPRPIPLHRRHRARAELAYLGEALASGHLIGDGRFTKACHARLAEAVGGHEVLLTGSCTTALEMAAVLARDAGPPVPGDAPPEVIVPAFTFVSTPNAFVLHGFRPVFADVLSETGNLDPEDVARRVTPRTRAVVPVHYAGVPCAMDALRTLADDAQALLIEDAAHALFATYRGEPVGALADLGTFSFHDTKNLSCGEGGALAFDEARFGDRPRVLRQKGTNRDAFLRGDVRKYDWVDLGGSYLPSELQAAVLLAQLEEAEAIQAKRARLHRDYLRALAPAADRGDVVLPRVPDGVESAHHLFAIRLADRATRDALSAHLRARGIGAVFHYLPLHLSPFGRRYGEGPGSLPVAEAWSATILRLPFHPNLSAAELDRIVDGVDGFFRARS